MDPCTMYLACALLFPAEIIEPPQPAFGDQVAGTTSPAIKLPEITPDNRRDQNSPDSDQDY